MLIKIKYSACVTWLSLSVLHLCNSLSVSKTLTIPLFTSVRLYKGFTTSFEIFVINAFQTKMWRSNLGKFRTILVFAAEKLCASERFEHRGVVVLPILCRILFV